MGFCLLVRVIKTTKALCELYSVLVKLFYFPSGANILCIQPLGQMKMVKINACGVESFLYQSHQLFLLIGEAAHSMEDYYKTHDTEN